LGEVVVPGAQTLRTLRSELPGDQQPRSPASVRPRARRDLLQHATGRGAYGARLQPAQGPRGRILARPLPRHSGGHRRALGTVLGVHRPQHGACRSSRPSGVRFRRVGPAQPIEIVCVWPLAELIFAGKAAYFDVDRALAYRAFLGWAIRHAKMSNSEPRRRRYAHGE
jgi:hypothetical protein